MSVGDRVILGLGGTGGGYWCGACRYCLSGQPRLCSESKRDHGHVRRVLLGVGALAGEAARQPRRPRGAARVRRPHRVRRGEEAARAPRPARSTDRGHRRRRRARPLRGADRERVRLPGGRRRHRRGAARLREVARRRPRGRRRRGRRRGPRASSVASTPAWCSRRGCPASGSASICSGHTGCSSPSACRRPARATSSSTRSSSS